MVDWPEKCRWVQEELKQRNAENLFFKLAGLREKLSPILSKIIETFPNYTIHDVRHKDSVCEILGWLIPAEIMKELSKFEIYFIVAAAYIHDLGMADIPELFDEQEFIDWVSEKGRRFEQSSHRKEFIREFHHTRSKQFILNHYSDYLIDNATEAEIIATIATGHRHLEDLKDFSIFKRKCMYQSNESVNLAELAYYLQIADELDLTFERTPMNIYYAFQLRDPKSMTEWQKALSVAGVGIDKYDKKRILVSAFCKDRFIHRALQVLENKIQQKLDISDHILDQSRHQHFPSRIFFDITKEGYDALELEIVFEMKSMIPLLSEHIYQRRQDAIREFLQNAIDACRKRVIVSNKSGKTYEPKIIVRYCNSEDRSVIEFEDNGEGMDENILSNYFGKIGRSYYTSREFTTNNPDFRPISEFGVGILSGFMISDSIIVETRAQGSDSYHIELFPSDRRILAIKGSKPDIGTKIILPLKKNVELDIIKEIRTYASHVEIPIVVESLGQTTEIQSEWFGYRQVTKTIPASNESEIRIEIKTADYRALVAFPATTWPNIGQVVYLIKERDGFGRYSSRANFGRLSRRGIFVQSLREDDIQNYLGIRGTIDIDILTGDIEVDASRSRFRQNDHFRKFMLNLKTIILNELEVVFDEYLKRDPALYKALSLDILNRFLIIRPYEQDDPLRNFLTKYGYTELVTKEGLKATPLSELAPNIELISNIPPILSSEVYAMFMLSGYTNQNPTVCTNYMKKIGRILNRNLPWRSFRSLFSYSNDLLGVPEISTMGGTYPLKKYHYVTRISFEALSFHNLLSSKLIIAINPLTPDPRSNERGLMLQVVVNMDHPFAKMLLQVRGKRLMTENKNDISTMLIALLNEEFENASQIANRILETLEMPSEEIIFDKNDIVKLLLPDDPELFFENVREEY